MWRFALVPFIIAAGGVAGEVVERLVGVEGLEWLVAWSVMMFGVAALWPVYFGLRAPPEDEAPRGGDPSTPTSRTAEGPAARR